MVEEFMDKIEEWNKPSKIEVDEYYLNNLEENERYYETFARVVESEVDFFDEKSDDPLEVIDNIKEYLQELREVLH